jgi:CHRD domain-containing protein
MRTSTVLTVLAVLAVVLGGVACTSTTGIQTAFQATLGGAYETPPVTSNGAANATFTVNGLTINYTLNITLAASSNYTASHIHTAAAGVSGPVRVNLCGAGTAPACPTGTGTVTGSFTATADTMTLPGTPALTYAGLVTALRGRVTYVNVHTVSNAGGEIRGEIMPSEQAKQ